MLVPRITKSNNSIVKQMYKDWYVLRAVTPEFMYWEKNEQVQYEEESQDKKAMYEKMKELKAVPSKWKAVEDKAYSLLTPEQRRSEACNFHKDSKIRELVMEMIQQ